MDMPTQKWTLFKVRSQERDINIINEVFISKYYHSALRFINEDYTIIDIGAHIGSFSILFGKIAKAGRIYAYESFIESYNLFKENIILNRIKNIIPFNLAICSKPSSRLKLYIKTIGGEYAGNSIYGSGKFVKVNSTNLNELFKINNISSCDLLKIDCEGAEYDIIFNSPKRIFKKIKNIILEYHKGYGDYKLLKDYLGSLGFKVREVKNGNIPLYKMKKVSLSSESFLAIVKYKNIDNAYFNNEKT
jgi:FkbM family methyltransferase